MGAGGMWGGGGGGGWWGGGGGLWTLLSLVALLALVAGVAYLIARSAKSRRSDPATDDHGMDPAMELLRERYARGDIDEEQFEERSSTLSSRS